MCYGKKGMKNLYTLLRIALFPLVCVTRAFKHWRGKPEKARESLLAGLVGIAIAAATIMTLRHGTVILGIKVWWTLAVLYGACLIWNVEIGCKISGEKLV